MYRQTKVSVTLPDSCPEQWDEMPHAGDGRFCAACQKTVTDFTLMSDAQIIAFIRNKDEGNHCGRFNGHQLDRELTYPKSTTFYTHPIFSKIAASLMLIQSIASSVKAQVTAPKTYIAPPLKESKTKKTPTKFIHGKVIDIASGTPLKGLKINVSGTSLTTITDANGRFYLALPARPTDTIVIAVSYGKGASPSPQGTVIENKTITASELNYNSEIIIYRYTADRLSEVSPAPDKVAQILEYTPYEKMGLYYTFARGRDIGLGYINDDVQIQQASKHKNLWQRVTGIFRRKKTASINKS